MSEMRVNQPETVQLSEEALTFADETMQQILRVLDEDIPQTGYRTSDETARYLREIDKSYQESFDESGHIYFGHTRKIDGYLYQALRAGYCPSEEQLAQHDGHDFLWDEIIELYTQHPDICRVISEECGYSSQQLPESVGFVGAYAVPKDVLKSILGIMYERGRQYKEWGWGFPWWSDSIPVEEIEK